VWTATKGSQPLTCCLRIGRAENLPGQIFSFLLQSPRPHHPTLPSKPHHPPRKILQARQLHLVVYRPILAPLVLTAGEGVVADLDGFGAADGQAQGFEGFFGFGA